MLSDHRCRRFLALVAFVVLGHVAPANAAPILSFGCTIDCSVVNQGDTFELFVRIDDVPDYDPDPNVTVGLATFSFYLGFNPAVVRVNDPSDVTYGGFLGPLGPSVSFLSSCDTDPAGQPCVQPLLIGGAIASPSLGVIGSGDLATIVFEAYGVGDSGLRLLNEPCDPMDPFCDVSFVPSFFNGLSEPIDLEIHDGTVRVESTAPVPEPGTIGLLSLGLLGVARHLRRKRG